jgi:hypothetical protein
VATIGREAEAAQPPRVRQQVASEQGAVSVGLLQALDVDQDQVARLARRHAHRARVHVALCETVRLELRRHEGEDRELEQQGDRRGQGREPGHRRQQAALPGPRRPGQHPVQHRRQQGDGEREQQHLAHELEQEDAAHAGAGGLQVPQVPEDLVQGGLAERTADPACQANAQAGQRIGREVQGGRQGGQAHRAQV